MKRKIIVLLIFVLAAVLAFSCVMIFREVSQSEKEKDDFEKLGEIIVEEIPSEIIKEEEKEESTSKRNLKPLFEQNQDCIGWVFIEDTNIDYPVMYTPQEPQKYLRKNFEGEYAMSGVPFMEGTRSLADDNIVIYGHNMKNGTMFSDITKYVDKAYYEQHKVMEFETAEGLKQYDIFAVAHIEEIDIWYYFASAINEEHFDEMIDYIKDYALYDTEIVPEYGKQLLTLSTCYGKNNEDRLIIIGTER